MKEGARKWYSQLGAGTGKVIMWLTGVTILARVIHLIAGLPISVAIIIGAIIIAEYLARHQRQFLMAVGYSKLLTRCRR